MNTEIIVKSRKLSCNIITALALAFLFLLSLNHQILSQTASTGHTSTSVQYYSANPAFLSFADTVFLWGPTFPPPLGSIFSESDSADTGAIGRTGGNNWFHSDVNLASLTTVYWGFVSDSIMMSFDDSVYSDTISTVYSEVMTYRPDLSVLAGGVAVWVGETRLPGNPTTVYTRFTVTFKEQVGDTALTLIDASTLGLPVDVGAVLLVTDSLAYNANLQVLASLDSLTGFIPALDFYDANTLADSGAFTSISAGFYWENVPPVLNRNNTLVVDEGSSGTITSTLLEATDPESSPMDIFFIVAPDTGLEPPLNGNVNLLGVPLGAGETFSQEDVDSGRVTYTHDGGETTSDGFPFRVMDANGGIATDAGFDVFFFNISINPVNDSPIVNDTSFATGIGLPFTGRMTGSDLDNDPLSFFITKNGNLGIATILNADSGTFLYTPFADTIGVDSLEIKAFDGTTFSAPGLIEITIANLPPVAIDGSGSTTEGVALTDTLTGTDLDTAQTLSFHIDVNGALGIASILDSLTGEFTYTPDTDAFGIDTFTFVVSDGQDSSLPGRYIVSIRPNIDPGDLLVAESDSDAVVLVDPLTGNQGILFSGEKLSDPKTIAIEDDGNLLVVDSDSGLIRIDPTTGTQTILSPSSNFAPSAPVGPIGITIESSGNILIADAENGVVRVDPVLGTVTTLSVGNNLTLAVGIVLDSNGDIFVSDAAAFGGGTSKIIGIDPATGNQRLISSGGNLTVPIGIAIDDNGDIWICDGGSVAGGSDIIMHIDTASGVQTVISSADLLNFPTGLAISLSGTLYIANQSSASVVSVDTSTGNQTLITSGGSLYQPFGLTLVPTSCCIGIRGDYNGDGLEATVLDLTFLIDDIFRGGPPAACQDETDLNNDGLFATVLDLTFLIDDIFRGGPSAPACP